MRHTLLWGLCSFFLHVSPPACANEAAPKTSDPIIVQGGEIVGYPLPSGGILLHDTKTNVTMRIPPGSEEPPPSAPESPSCTMGRTRSQTGGTSTAALGCLIGLHLMLARRQRKRSTAKFVSAT